MTDAELETLAIKTCKEWSQWTKTDSVDQWHLNRLIRETLCEVRDGTLQKNDRTNISEEHVNSENIRDSELERMAEPMMEWVDTNYDDNAPARFKLELMELLRTVRDSVVQLPDAASFQREVASIEDVTDFAIGAWSAYDWLRTQLKTVQPISDEELEKLIDEFYTDIPNGWGPRTKLKKLLQKVSR